MLIFSIALKVFPPKKPNFYYGYQLGSARRSLEHWKLANNYAANYLILLYSVLITMSAVFNYIEFDGGILILVTLIIGLIITYFLIERKLERKITNTTSGNPR